RKLGGQFPYAALHIISYFFRLRLANNRRDHLSNLAHLGFFHAARRDGGSADAQTRRDERLVLIERNRVLVDGDVRGFESLLSILAGDSLPVHPYIDEHQMIVSAA